MSEITILVLTAIFIGTVHTLIGVDHYVPFVVLSKANNWSMKKTICVVFICGVCHVLSSVLLGVIGIIMETNISNLVNIESLRGDITVWILVSFGIIYFVWGIKKAMTNKNKVSNIEGDFKEEDNSIIDRSIHKTTAFWGLFILFVLGPCEPLIPILMYPAFKFNLASLVLVTLCFAVCTIATMIISTFVLIKGINLISIKKIERYTHAIAGFSIFACGLAILLFDI